MLDSDDHLVHLASRLADVEHGEPGLLDERPMARFPLFGRRARPAATSGLWWCAEHQPWTSLSLVGRTVAAGRRESDGSHLRLCRWWLTGAAARYQGSLRGVLKEMPGSAAASPRSAPILVCVPSSIRGPFDHQDGCGGDSVPIRAVLGLAPGRNRNGQRAQAGVEPALAAARHMRIGATSPGRSIPHICTWLSAAALRAGIGRLRLAKALVVGPERPG